MRAGLVWKGRNCAEIRADYSQRRLNCNAARPTLAATSGGNGTWRPSTLAGFLGPR
jgi:hypothetical protein